MNRITTKATEQAFDDLPQTLKNIIRSPLKQKIWKKDEICRDQDIGDTDKTSG